MFCCARYSKRDPLTRARLIRANDNPRRNLTAHAKALSMLISDADAVNLIMALFHISQLDAVRLPAP